MLQLIKFGIIGFLNTSITLSTYALLVYVVGVNFLLANIIGYLLGGINSYIWNKNWVFQVREHRFSFYVKFIIVNVAMLGLHTLGLFILVELLDLQKMISQIIVVGLVMVINFFLTKTWSFATRKGSFG
jgi:putative flippase GtrA